MKAEDIQIDLKELENFKKKNQEERLKFIDDMVDYIKKNGEAKWSEQQKIIVNSQTN